MPSDAPGRATLLLLLRNTAIDRARGGDAKAGSKGLVPPRPRGVAVSLPAPPPPLKSWYESPPPTPAELRVVVLLLPLETVDPLLRRDPRPLSGDEPKNEGVDCCCGPSPLEYGSDAGVVPGGANAGGFAASKLKGFRTTIAAAAGAEGEEGCRRPVGEAGVVAKTLPPAPAAAEAAAVAAVADMAWESARRVRHDLLASLRPMTKALPHRLYSLLRDWPTTKRTKYRLNLARTDMWCVIPRSRGRDGGAEALLGWHDLESQNQTKIKFDGF